MVEPLVVVEQVPIHDVEELSLEAALGFLRCLELRAAAVTLALWGSMPMTITLVFFRREHGDHDGQPDFRRSHASVEPRRAGADRPGGLVASHLSKRPVVVLSAVPAGWCTPTRQEKGRTVTTMDLVALYGVGPDTPERLWWPPVTTGPAQRGHLRPPLRSVITGRVVGQAASPPAQPGRNRQAIAAPGASCSPAWRRTRGPSATSNDGARKDSPRPRRCAA